MIEVQLFNIQSKQTYVLKYKRLINTSLNKSETRRGNNLAAIGVNNA